MALTYISEHHDEMYEFPWWSGGKEWYEYWDKYDKLDEVEEVIKESLMMDNLPEGKQITNIDINTFMWFHSDAIASVIGWDLKHNCPDEEEDDDIVEESVQGNPNSSGVTINKKQLMNDILNTYRKYRKYYDSQSGIIDLFTIENNKVFWNGEYNPNTGYSESDLKRNNNFMIELENGYLIYAIGEYGSLTDDDLYDINEAYEEAMEQLEVDMIYDDDIVEESVQGNPNSSGVTINKEQLMNDILDTYREYADSQSGIIDLFTVCDGVVCWNGEYNPNTVYTNDDLKRNNDFMFDFEDGTVAGESSLLSDDDLDDIEEVYFNAMEQLEIDGGYINDDEYDIDFEEDLDDVDYDDDYEPNDNDYEDIREVFGDDENIEDIIGDIEEEDIVEECGDSKPSPKRK